MAGWRQHAQRGRPNAAAFPGEDRGGHALLLILTLTRGLNPTPKPDPNPNQVVPYFFGSGGLTGVPFARAAAYLRRARATRTKTRALALALTLALALALPPAPILTLARHARASHAAYAALCSDETTLARTNLRYAAAGATPRYGVPSLAVDAAAAALIDGTDASTCERWAAEATADARREAAGRLAARPACVAAFARRCATRPGESPEEPSEEGMYPEEYPISPPSSSVISSAISPPSSAVISPPSSPPVSSSVSSPSSSVISPSSSHGTDEDEAVCEALRAVASLLLLPPRHAGADAASREAEVRCSLQRIRLQP